MKTIRILLADDHDVVREGIRSLFGHDDGQRMDVVGEAATGAEVLEIAQDTPVDVFVLDVNLPDMNGLETAAILMKEDPQRRVMILSAYGERYLVKRAVNCGARGYVVKGDPVETLKEAIRTVHKGGVFFSSQVEQAGRAALRERADRHRINADTCSVEKLARREREFLQFAGEGLSDKDIARKMGISYNTARWYRKQVMQKLDIHKQSALMRYAMREGMSGL